MDTHSAVLSKSYPEVGEILFSEDAIHRRIAELGREITRDFAGQELIVVGMLKGAILFACDLVRCVELPLRLDFISIAKFRRHGRPTGISLLKDLDCDISGKSVLIVEDIIDTGFTTNYLLRNLRARNPERIAVCTLLDRRSIRIIDVAIEYRGFVVGEDYVVGYGLDCREQYRDLPFIARLRSAAESSP